MRPVGPIAEVGTKKFPKEHRAAGVRDFIQCAGGVMLPDAN